VKAKLVIWSFLIWSFAVAAPAAAQTPRQSSSKPAIGLFALYDYASIASPKSFDAVFGKHTASAPGVGIDVVHLWRGAFVRIDGSKATMKGERVIVFDGTVFKLGIPLTAELTPLEFGAGWRFGSNPRARVTPYVGASAISLKYTEKSQFADSSENVNESYSGFGVFGGADIRITRQIFGGIEGQYRAIKITPTASSAAGSFNEKDLGGAVVRVRAGIRF